MTKYQKADLLRKKYIELWEDSILFMSEWEETNDSRYKAFAKKAQEDADKAFNRYSAYIHWAFHEDDIKKARMKTKCFTAKKFLFCLSALDQRRIKKGRQSYV